MDKYEDDEYEDEVLDQIENKICDYIECPEDKNCTKCILNWCAKIVNRHKISIKGEE